MNVTRSHLRSVPTAAAALSQIEEHWFAYGESCVSVLEKRPAGKGFAHAPILFFFHGRLAGRDAWSAVDDALAAHHHCIEPSFPGFGRSFTSTGRGLSLIDQAALGIELIRSQLAHGRRAILVGHDTGAAVAQFCARELPADQVAGVVIVNGACMQEAVPLFRTSRHPFLVRRGLRRLLGDCAVMSEPERTRLNAVVAAPWRPRYTRAALREAVRAIHESWPGPFERRLWRRELRELACPVLLLWGMRDPLNVSRRADELLQLLPEACLFTDSGSGHWPMLENPAWILDKIQEFVFRIEDAGGRHDKGFSPARKSLSR